MADIELKDCTCKTCVSACEQVPGWLAPGEAEKIAEFLELDLEKFVKLFLIKDHCSAEWASDAPYVYSPRKVGVDPDEAEIRSHADQHKPGHCVFLIKGRCSIHQVKPYECKNTMGCNFKDGTRNTLEAKWIDAGAPLGMRPENIYSDGEPRFAGRMGIW